MKTKLRDIILTLGLAIPFIFFFFGPLEIGGLAAAFYIFGCTVSGFAFYAFGKAQQREKALDAYTRGMDDARRIYDKN